MELVIEQLSAWYGSGTDRAQVLDQVSLDVTSGALAAVLGPSGSGKTTLLRAIAGLHKDVVGSIRLGGRRLDGVPPEQRRVGLVPQDGALFPHLSVTENIEFGLPRSARRGRRTHEMLELLGLGPYAKRLPHQLSGGQAQRVAVARSLAPAPDLLLLDEPFSALDAALRHEVRDGVRAALAETGTTALLVTHDQSEALSMSSQLTVLTDGTVRQTGSPRDLYNEPVDLWTARFLGDANIVTGVSDGTIATTDLGHIRHTSVRPGAVRLVIRPEQLRVGRDDGVPATVHDVRYFGHDSLVRLELDRGGSLLIRLSAGGVLPVDSRVLVTVDAVVRAFPADEDQAPS
ncbi:ABC transporter ATP-binding protein [uncultured Aeromicrobium sp.]|uniref:ABC transporter ATP-binding protein n=1 Tax=uncultured Aeromicrobium sp. TaxID=337820 RepID=UPI0025D12EA5|nr:ABC transporter ATP-binding protein [uncultured Aeromicrobium sp.]